MPQLPRWSIRDYAKELRLKGIDRQLFIHIMRETDRHFVNLNLEEQRANDSAMKAKGSNQSKVAARRKKTLRSAGRG